MATVFYICVDGCRVAVDVLVPEPVLVQSGRLQ